MAKRTRMPADTDTDQTAADGRKPTALGKKAHHAAMESKGNVMIDAHRPRGAGHVMETWLTPGRRLRILQVADDGPITAYDEAAKVDDPSSLGQ